MGTSRDLLDHRLVPAAGRALHRPEESARSCRTLYEAGRRSEAGTRGGIVGAPSIEDLDDTTFDPYIADDAMYGDEPDPYAQLHELRARGPVLPIESADMGHHASPDVDGQSFMVLSYAGVEDVLNDAVTFSNSPFRYSLGISFGQTLSVMDPPEHTAYRRILQKAFRPPVVARWGDGIVAPVIDELVSAFRDDGRADLVEQLARPYPFNVIYRMLGLPPADIEVFYKLTIAQIVFSSPDLPREAGEKLGRYFTTMIAERRADPGDDVVSTIATAEIDGEHLPADVAISFLRQLINAGGDTTFRTTTALLTGLFNNPDQLAAVRADRSLVPQAVEEALRWEGPVIGSARSTTRDAVIDGVAVPANAQLAVSYGAANHDPAVFERPDDFDIFRERHRHFGFAFGAHNCLGQQLARLEMSRALVAILDALPNVRLDPDHPAPRMLGSIMRTPRALHVVFD
jgi:cytochrome P450